MGLPVPSGNSMANLGLRGVGARASAVEDLAQCEPDALEKAGAGEQGIKGKRDQKHGKARRDPPRPDLAQGEMLAATNDRKEGYVRRCRGVCAPRLDVLACLLGVEHESPNDAEERDDAKSKDRGDVAEHDHLSQRNQAGTPEERIA